MNSATFCESVKPINKKKKKRIAVFDIFNYIFLLLLSLICIFPVAYELLLSFSSKTDYLNSTILVIPYHFNFEAYKYIFGQGRVLRALGVSVLVTVIGTIYSLILTFFGAYAFTKKNVPGLKIFFTIMIITMFFSGGIIPFYLTVKSIVGLNSLASLIIPFGINAFNLIIMRNFFSQVPNEIIESAKLDGASEFRILFQLVVPLSKSGIATVLLWYVVSYWDAWYWPSFFLNKKEELYPLALELRNLLQGLDGSNPVAPGTELDGTQLFGQGQNAATIMISILPILIFYPFIQKYFVKGVMLGSVKG